MGSFDSPIGGRRIVGQPLREFDVPDGDDQPQAYAPQPGMNPRQRLGGFGPQQMPDLNAAMDFQSKLEAQEAEDFANVEREMKAAKEARRTGKIRLSEGAKRRIEMLIDMTRSTRDAEIGGNVYVFQTLSGEEMRSAILAASKFDGTVQSPYEIRRQLLSYSLTQVAGLSVSQFVGSNEHEAKLEMLDSLPEVLLQRLYDEYLILVRESSDKFAIKSQADVQEVIEDLKK